MTQAGLIAPTRVLRGAWPAFALAALCGISADRCAAAGRCSAIGLASIAAAYAYTGGPYPLAYHGLGELFVFVFFGFVAVGGTFYAAGARSSTQPALLGGLAVGLAGDGAAGDQQPARRRQRSRAATSGRWPCVSARRFARAEIVVLRAGCRSPSWP